MAFEEFTGELDVPAGGVAYTPFTGKLDAAEAAAEPDIGFADPMGGGGAEIMATAQPKRSSVLEGVQIPEPKFDEAQALRMSTRAGAEREFLPGDPRLTAPEMRAITGKTVRPSESGILGRAGQMAGSAAGGAAAGAIRLGSEIAGAAGAQGVSSALQRAARGTREIAAERGLSAAMTGEIAQGDRTLSGLNQFTEKYAPQILAQLPQMAATVATGGVTLPFMLTGLAAYDDARERGIDPVNSVAYALGQGTAEAVGEKLGGMSKLANAFESTLKAGFGRNAVSRLGQAMVSAGAREVPSEELTYAAQFAIDKAAGMNPEAGIKEFFEGAKDTAIVAAGAGGIVGGGGAALATGAARPGRIDTAEQMARARGFLVPEPTPQQRIAEIGKAENVDQAIAAAQSAVQSSTAVDNIAQILEKTLPPAQSPQAQAAIESAAGLIPEIAQTTQAITELEAADVRLPTDVPSVPTTPAGGGLSERGVGVEAGLGVGAVAGPAVDTRGVRVEPAGDFVPLEPGTPLDALDQRLIPVSKRTTSTSQDVKDQATARPSSQAQAAPAETPEAGARAGVQPAAAGTQARAAGLEAARVDQRLVPVSKRVKPAAEIAPASQISEVAAAQQRADFAAAEKARKVPGHAARARAHDTNPFKAFLGKHGISNSLIAEFAPGRKERQAAMVQGYGPVFRKSGPQIDILAQRAVEEGFLLEPDEAKLHSLIIDALRGKRIIAQYAEGVAEDEMQARISRQQELEQEAEEAFSQLPESVLQDLDAGIPGFDSESNTSTEAAMQALGFTDQEIQDATASQSQGQSQSRQGDGEDDAVAARQTQGIAAEGNAAPRDEAEGLTAPSQQDVLAQQRRAAEGAAAEAKAAMAAENRARADAELPEFTLTGSTRAADADTNQRPIFSRAAPEPASTAQQATDILDAAGLTGKDRIDALKDVKAGTITPEELKAAYPAKAAAEQPAMSRAAPAGPVPALEPFKTKSGATAFKTPEIALADPRLNIRQPGGAVTRIDYEIRDRKLYAQAISEGATPADARDEASVGIITLDVDSAGAFKSLRNIEVFQSKRGNTIAEKVVGGIVESLPAGAKLHIHDILPKAVGFWDKMGAKFPRSEDFMEANLSPEQFRNAYDTRKSTPGTRGQPQESRAAEDTGAGSRRPGPDGTPVQGSAGQPAVRNPSTVERVQAAVTELIGGKQLPNKLGRVVATTAAEIKSRWEPIIGQNLQIGSEGEAGVAQGFYDPVTKTVFLIADHIEQGSETAILAHELMHKHGQAVLGAEGWDRLHSVINTWADAEADSDERAVYDYARSRVEAVGMELSSQEMFPYAVEAAIKMGVKPSLIAKQGTVARWLGSVKYAMQQAWGKVTGKPENFKTQDLVDMAFGIAQMENPESAAEIVGALQSAAIISPGSEFWSKIEAGENFTTKELEDAYSIGRRGGTRAGQPVRQNQSFSPSEAAGESFKWRGKIADFDGYRTYQIETDPGQFLVAVSPEEVVEQYGETQDSSVIGYLFTKLNDGSYALDLIDPMPGTAGFNALEESGAIEETGDINDVDGTPYYRVKLADRYGTSRALLQESVRRLALHIGKVPIIVQTGRETGARAGDIRSREFSSETIKAKFSRAAPQVGVPPTPTNPTLNPWRDETGRMQFAPGAWLYNQLGKAAGPTLIKLGMKAATPELRRQLRQMKIDVEKAQETAAAIARETTKLSEAERTMVSDLVEQEMKVGVIPPAHAVKLAAMINDAMGRQTDELVDLGMLTKDSADKWRGKYLPRYYESKLQDKLGNAWADALKRLTGRQSVMKGIKGKHLKGRGLYETIPEADLPNYEAMGWEVRDPDYQPNLPAVDGTVQVWRDFSPAERERMGEIRDAGFRFVMGYMQTQKDIALGKMFERMAADPEQSSRLEKEGYVQVPTTTVSGTGAKVYGKLAGRWVPTETLSQLSNIEESTSDAWQMYRKAMGIWKEGKALALDTPLPTPTGWTTMGDIQAGDMVFDEQGKPCEVTYATDVQLGRECYEVEFSDGCKIVADAEHLWFTIKAAKGGIRSTQQILATLKEATRGDNKHSIPVAAALQIAEVTLPIPPYALGAWLGDGNSASAAVCAGSADADETAANIRTSGLAVGAYQIDKRNGVVTFGIRYADASLKRCEGLQPTMRAMNLLGNKHIPAIYLRGSEAQRMELLQGLMDTDGSISAEGRMCEFTTILPALRDGVIELLRSLGFKPQFVSHRAMIGEKDCGLSWRISFRGYANRPVFKMIRKSARLLPAPATRQRSGTRQIVAVRAVPSVPVKCITVDSESRLYLAGAGMIPTHNTSLNPVSHVNNMASNLTMAHLAGVSYHRGDKYLAAARDFVKKSPMLAEAKENGLFLGTLSDAELMNSMPEELRILAQKQESTTAKVARTGFDIMTMFLRKPMGAAYQAEDTFFRYLIYKDARERGVDPQDAVDYAQKYIFTYDDLPKGARRIRDFGLPFFSYTYKAVPALLHTALTHPVRMAAPAAVLWGINAAAYAIAAGDDDDSWQDALKKYLTDPAFRAKAKEQEKLEREHLPSWMKGTTSLMTPKTLRLGMDEVTKLPLFIDISRIIPGGDLFDISPNAGGIPLPQPITPSHPLFTTAVAMLANRDLFRGKDLVDKNDTRSEAAEKRAAWMWTQLAPAVAAGNYHWQRGMNALAQATGKEVTWMPDMLGGDATGIDRQGLPVQPKYTAMQTFGIKVRPIDLDTSAAIDKNMQRKMLRDIDAEMSALRRLESKGAVSARAVDKARELADIKKERLKQGLTVEGAEKD